MSLPTEKVDAIVVGSGAAGSTVAANLARGGKQVHILEAGPRLQNSDLVSSTLWARRLKWSGAPVVESGNNPVGHGFNAGSGLGGSAMHHYAVWPRFHAEDFQMYERYQRGLNWPISYDDLRPFYDQVQREAGVSGDAALEKWRPAGDDYPMAPVPLFAQGKLIQNGFDKLGMHTAPLPLAVNSEVYNGRAPCIWDGWCDAGCPIGALANPQTVYLPIATSNKAVIHTDTTVTRLLTDASGEKIDAVEVVTKNGTRKRLSADVIVLAAFSVQNPRILLASANDRHPEGLANSSGTLGRYMMSHAAGLIYGLFAEDTQCYMGAFGGQLVNQDNYQKDSHADSGAFGSYQWMVAQAVKPNDLLGIATTRGDLFGVKLEAFMQRAAKGFAGMTAVVEDMPLAGNRLTLNARKDEYGVPLASVHHSTDPASIALWQATLTEGQAVFNAAGADEVWTGPQGSMHIMGGTIMGADSTSSVCDGFGRCHDFENLYIAGPGLFPTSAGVNPTFTAQALAARSADHLLNNWPA
ncbi:MAG: GMC family oxidoreductase [Pseudomonadota bacterium]